MARIHEFESRPPCVDLRAAILYQDPDKTERHQVTQLCETVRHYVFEVRNGRSVGDAFGSLRSEVDELETEVETGGAGTDGIKGEAMDVINSALDVLFLAHPEVTFREIDALMEEKCRKWLVKYGDGETGNLAEFAAATASVADLLDNGLPASFAAQLMHVEENSVRRIAAGSYASRVTRERLGAIHPAVKEAFGGGYRTVTRLWKTSSAAGTTLGDILCAPVFDLAAFGAYCAAFRPAIERYARQDNDGWTSARGGNGFVDDMPEVAFPSSMVD
jgi:hypothetical protein